MVGAIEFLKAWRDHCLTHQTCKGCVIKKECCVENTVSCMADEEIVSLVRKVMDWKAQEEQKK